MSGESYTDLITSWPHIGFHITYDLVVFYLLSKVAKPVSRRWKDKFHAELDSSHGLQHDLSGKVRNVDDIIAERDSAVKIANINAQAYAEQKQAAEELRNTLQAVMKKPLQ